MPKARKKSADPAQEALRSHKAEWNEAQKAFVASLIGFKQGLNGRGSAKAGLPPSNIKNPLPGEVGSFLSNLSSQFQTLVSGAGSIMSEQQNYSQHRRQKQEKKPPTAAPIQIAPSANQDNKVVETLSNIASSKNAVIEKYASNWLSRRLQYAKSYIPFVGGPDDGKRMGLLSLGEDIFYDFLNLENSFLSLDLDTVPEIVAQHQMLSHNLDAFKLSINSDKPVVLDKPPANPGDPSVADPTTPAVPPTTPAAVVDAPPVSTVTVLPPPEMMMAFLTEVAENIYTIASSSLPLKKESSKLLNQVTMLNSEDDQVKKLAMFKQIETDYQILLNTVRASITQEPNEIKRKELEQLIASANIDSDQIVKLAHNYVTRKLKKWWLKKRKSNKSAWPRIKAADAIDRIKKIMQRILSALEKNLNIEALNKEIGLIDDEMEILNGSLRVLNSLYRQKFYADYNKNFKKKHKDVEKGHNPLMDRVWQTELRRDFRRSIV
jgi:hypothetical protein